MPRARNRIVHEAALFGWDHTSSDERLDHFTSPSWNATLTVEYDGHGRVRSALRAQTAAGAYHRDFHEIRGLGATWRVVRFIHRRGRRMR